METVFGLEFFFSGGRGSEDGGFGEEGFDLKNYSTPAGTINNNNNKKKQNTSANKKIFTLQWGHQYSVCFNEIPLGISGDEADNAGDVKQIYPGTRRQY